MVFFSELYKTRSIRFNPHSDNGFLKPLDKKTEYELFKKSQNGDKKATEELVAHNMRLVVHVAKRYCQSVDHEELISIGSAGLLKAVRTFNIDKGTQFSTYGAKCIDNEILMYLRANKKNLVNVSLFQPIGSDKDGNEICLSDTICDENYNVSKSIEEEDFRAEIKDIMDHTLTKREKMIITYRYGLFGTTRTPQREVAKMLNISRSYISRIEKKALQKMKAYIQKNGYED